MLETFSGVGKNWAMEDVKAFFDLIDVDKSIGRQGRFMQFIADVEAMSVLLVTSSKVSLTVGPRSS